MDLKDFIDEIDFGRCKSVKFVGIKWQDESHPSAEEFPVEFVSADAFGDVLKIKFVTKPHNK